MVMQPVLYKRQAIGVYQKAIYIKLLYKLYNHFVILRMWSLSGQIKMQKRKKVWKIILEKDS